MPKAAAIHPDITESEVPPLEEPATPAPPPPVAPFGEPRQDDSGTGDAGGFDLDARTRQLRELVVAHPLASLGATLAIGASLGILLKRLR